MAVGTLALGLLSGAVSSLLPGPCNIAVVATAWRHGTARATATGAGVACGDALYAVLGVLGIASAIARAPMLPLILRVISGLGALGYVLVLVRARPAPARTRRDASARLTSGFGTGLVLVAANPAALLTWTLVAGWLVAGTPVAVASGVVGIGAGSFAGYAGVARIAAAAARRAAGRPGQLR